MHELSLATALVEQLQRVCAEQQAAAVVSVRLRVGALAGVDRESFAFVFPIAAEGTCAEKAGLVFDEVPAEVTCGACGRRWQPKRMFLHCESCQSNQVRVTRGREFDLVSVEVSMGEDSGVRSQNENENGGNANGMSPEIPDQLRTLVSSCGGGLRPPEAPILTQSAVRDRRYRMPANER